MAPGSSSQRMRRAAPERPVAAVAVSPSVSDGPTAQSDTAMSQPREEHFTPAPPLEDTIPAAENSGNETTGTTTASERPPALSIRCKKTKLPDMVDMATGNATTMQRRVVVRTKTEYLVRLNNNKRLKVEYSTRHRGPAMREFRSLMSRDIGSIIRGKVLMLAPSFLSLSDMHRDVVNTGIETKYDISATDVEMWNFIDAIAQTIYKEWKYDCHQHYLHVNQETHAEFLRREEECAWLKSHFEDPDYLKLCERNRGNRNKNKEQQLNHHSGSLALSYRSEVLEKEGHKAPATWIDIYQPDKNEAEKVAAVKRRLDEVLSQQDSAAGDDEDDVVSRAHHLSLDTQINIIEEEMGSRPGTSIRGVGRAVTRDPEARGGARVTSNLEETQSLKREVAEAKEEARKSRDDYNVFAQRVQQMEALMRSIQSGSQQAPVPAPAPGTQSSCNAVPDHESTL